MNNNKAIPILLGIGIILYFLASYLVSKSPFDVFFITMGIMAIIFGFYTEDKKIKVSLSYFAAAFGVNSIQWLILTYIFYYYQVYNRTEYLILLIGALWITLFLANQIRKEYLKSSETTVNLLKDKTKLILLFMGVIIVIGSLASFIAYYTPIFLYGITLGLMTLIYGFYHEDKKVNISWNYAKAMGFLIILQGIILLSWFTLFYYNRQISIHDWPIVSSFSWMITIYFSIQIYRSGLIKVPNEKKEMIVGISAIAIFIVFFGALTLK